MMIPELEEGVMMCCFANGEDGAKELGPDI